MPPQDDHADGPSTLPHPDLNPLLNPLLGQNMGRWAEVYFTSAPEKREQAVLDLLRELQAESAASAVAPRPPVSEEAAQPVTGTAGVRAARVRCPACGRENPASHRFCGMCGRAVAGHGTAPDLPVAGPAAELPVPDFGVADFSAADLVADLDSARLDSGGLEAVLFEDRHVGDPRQAERGNASEFAPVKTAFHAPALLGSELPLSAPRQEDDYRAYQTGGILDPAPASRPRRVYLGIALACVIVVLAYMAWRSVQAPPSSLVALQATPAVMTQPAASAPTLLNPSTVAAPDSSSPASRQAAVPSRDGTDRVPGASAKADAASRAASTSAINQKNTQAAALAGNGGEELATAQSYLNGTAGRQRDSAEAAKWLWKAIAKHNGEAALLLSDLYLKGDGVAQNCDQARVLLDAAAVRGVKGAAERLRHLQAFGCS